MSISNPASDCTARLSRGFAALIVRFGAVRCGRVLGGRNFYQPKMGLFFEEFDYTASLKNFQYFVKRSLTTEFSFRALCQKE
jgi:hypothetical protein